MVAETLCFDQQKLPQRVVGCARVRLVALLWVVNDEMAQSCIRTPHLHFKLNHIADPFAVVKLLHRVNVKRTLGFADFKRAVVIANNAIWRRANPRILVVHPKPARSHLFIEEPTKHTQCGCLQVVPALHDLL